MECAPWVGSPITTSKGQPMDSTIKDMKTINSKKNLFEQTENLNAYKSVLHIMK